MVDSRPERELKLAVDRGFRMPSIYGLAGPTVRRSPPERNATTYYDTADLHLARWGASLRHRPGEGWTVKLPAEREAPFLVRPEITFEGNGGAPPSEAVELVRGFVRDRELREQVRMTTVRQRSTLYDENGQLVAGVVDDTVSARNGAGSAIVFRELEVEIGDDLSPQLLDALVERLRQAGAGAPDPTAKYLRALGEGPALVPEIRVSDLAADATGGEVVQRALAASVIRLIRHDPIVRLDTDVEGVHQARVATRRLRSDLRTFGKLVDHEWASSLRRDLKMLADALGEVRDGDVLLGRLRRRTERLRKESLTGADEILGALESLRGEAYARVLTEMRADRYFALLERLVVAAGEPALHDRANAPARDVLPKLVRRPWRSLEMRIAQFDSSPSDQELHDARIRTKRVRYAAEAAAPVLGPEAQAFARAAGRLQDVLGNLNDAVVAAHWLDDWASSSGATAAGVEAAAELAAIERAAAESSRKRWEKAWHELAEPALRTWM